MASNWPWLNLAGRPDASMAVSKAASVQPVAAAAAVAPAGDELPASGAALGLVGSAAVCDAGASVLGPHAARPAAAPAALAAPIMFRRVINVGIVSMAWSRFSRKRQHRY